MDYNGLVKRIKWVNVCKALSLLLGKHLVIIGVVIIANSRFLRCIRRSTLPPMMRSILISGTSGILFHLILLHVRFPGKQTLRLVGKSTRECSWHQHLQEKGRGQDWLDRVWAGYSHSNGLNWFHRMLWVEMVSGPSCAGDMRDWLFYGLIKQFLD